MGRMNGIGMAFSKFAVFVIVLGLSVIPVRGTDKDNKKVPFNIVIYESGEQGYHTYRIPALVVTGKGTLLAFCEGRKTSRSDHGDIDLILRRSSDEGRTWDRQRIVYEEGGTEKITIGNPCAVVDKENGTVWLTFCRDNDRIFITHSADEGESWAKPREITKDVKEPEWGWYATGPGHGIQLQRGKYKGRLVIPCDCGDSKGWGNWDQKGRSLVIYSDDHGKSWTHGDITDKGMNECEVVELEDGSLLLSMRNYRGPKLRAFAHSKDGGRTWSSSRHHDQVYCPTCQASIQRYSWQPNIIVHCSPGGPGRENMTVRLSYDEGQKWSITKVLEEGPGAYSDLAVLPDGQICCFFEDDGYKRIVFSRFSLQWLTDKNK
jgi:sialidase-1